jgi:hypothetical protein
MEVPVITIVGMTEWFQSLLLDKMKNKDAPLFKHVIHVLV